MNDISSKNENSLEHKLKSDANKFATQVSDISKQRLFSRMENELNNNRDGVFEELLADNSKTRSPNSSRLFALAASVLVILSLGVIIFKESGTEVSLNPEVVKIQKETESNSLVVEQLVANQQGSEASIEGKLVASKKLNKELNLIKSDIDKLAKRIASL